MANPSLELLDCGSDVVTKLSKIEATIIGINIRFGAIQYEISYFKDGEHKTTWVYANEVEAGADIKKIFIGFRRHE